MQHYNNVIVGNMAPVQQCFHSPSIELFSVYDYSFDPNAGEKRLIILSCDRTTCTSTKRKSE